MASAAEIVELGLDQMVHLGIGLVAVEAESLPGGVEEVVVAPDAVLGDVIGVSEGEGEKRARGSQPVLTERGEAALETSDPDELRDWLLTRIFGIDHILVDEAQDTSPAQWAVIERLTQEFATGEGGPFAAGGRCQV